MSDYLLVFFGIPLIASVLFVGFAILRAWLNGPAEHQRSSRHSAIYVTVSLYR